MKRIAAIILLSLLLSCATAVDRGLLEQGIRDLPVSRLENDPEGLRGKIFVLGGLIVNTKLSAGGSTIEAIYLPVDARGYPQDMPGKTNRFLAVYPATRGFLDPAVYRSNRIVTVAGTFKEMRSGRIDEMTYVYPVFLIQDIHLWEERVYPPSWWGDPWRTYPYPYWYYPYRSPYWGWGPPWW